MKSYHVTFSRSERTVDLRGDEARRVLEASSPMLRRILPQIMDTDRAHRAKSRLAWYKRWFAWLP